MLLIKSMFVVKNGRPLHDRHPLILSGGVSVGLDRPGGSLSGRFFWARFFANAKLTEGGGCLTDSRGGLWIEFRRLGFVDWACGWGGGWGNTDEEDLCNDV
jgi:hypothetical protein